MSDPLILPTPMPRIIDYPASIGMALLVIFTATLLFLTGKFDPTGGVFTISLLVALTFIGMCVFCLFFAVPGGEITSSVIGGLTAAFGAVVAHWLGKGAAK